MEKNKYQRFNKFGLLNHDINLKNNISMDDIEKKNIIFIQKKKVQISRRQQK